MESSETPRLALVCSHPPPDESKESNLFEISLPTVSAADFALLSCFVPSEPGTASRLTLV